MKGDFNFKVIITIALILLPIVAMSACAENIGTITKYLIIVLVSQIWCLLPAP